MKKIGYVPDMLAILAIFVLLGCTNRVENPTVINELPKIYPDYVGVTIPVEIAPLNFNSVTGIL